MYFRDPRSPWQRFPKGTSLAAHSQDELDRVAEQPDGRPRKTLGWMNATEKMRELLGWVRSVAGSGRPEPQPGESVSRQPLRPEIQDQAHTDRTKNNSTTARNASVALTGISPPLSAFAKITISGFTP